MVSSRLEEGDFRGAVKIASSTSTITETSEETFTALQDKHPPAAYTSYPTPLQSVDNFFVNVLEVAAAIDSFPAGSSDGLRPQHLKDMLADGQSDADRSPLLITLASFCDLVLEGKTPVSVCLFFFGARLTALKKKDGGVRPIAAGCTLRCLVAKIACDRVADDVFCAPSPAIGLQSKGWY